MPHMKRSKFPLLVLLTATLLAATACSPKGVHMPKHRKSRNCNCPTFGQAIPQERSADTLQYDS